MSSHNGVSRPADLGPLRIVLFRRDDRLVAQALERNIVASGQTVYEALAKLYHVIEQEVRIRQKLGLPSLEEGVSPAADTFHKWFQDGQSLPPSTPLPPPPSNSPFAPLTLDSCRILG